MAVPTAVITSRTNSRVKQLRAAFSKGLGYDGDLVAIEGEHLVHEALRSRITPQTLFLTPAYPLPPDLSRETEVIRLAEDVFSSAVETRTPQGIAALIQPPSWELKEIVQRPAALLLILVGLQDPGNMGTLIRSAEAFGATGVLTTPGTVSEWNQKALRASVGSTFRMPVLPVGEKEIVDLCNRGIHLYAAVGQHETAFPAREVDLHQPSAIMIGNEGAGLSDNWIRLSTKRITIPCPGPVESLNAAVAGSLLLYEASRQRSMTIRNGDPLGHIPNTQPRRPTGAAR